MRILIVEDDHRIANTVKKGLEMEGFVVDVAYDGQEGHDLASSEGYDLLVLDLMLPEMDGLAICKSLRGVKNNVPILILTAKGQVQDKVEALNSGADDYLVKPFSFEELLARVKALSRRPLSLTETTLLVGDLSLNKNTFLVERDGKQINLSSKEFVLLQFMMEHAGNILSKDQIMNHVWDYESDILPNTIEVYIRNLRRKIDLPFKDKAPLISTVRGFGYKIG
jgi:DNA-binding response OmpR family regulator